MTVLLRAFGALALIVPLLAPGGARAELHIDLTHGQTQPMPIALPPFGGEGGNGQLGRQIVGVVSNDLQGSGLFQPLDPRSFIQDVSTGAPPDFGAWRQINAQALVSGTVQTQPDGKARVEFRLWDVFAGQQLAGFAYTTTPQNWRRIAHIIADEVYKRLTGEDVQSIGECRQAHRLYDRNASRPFDAEGERHDLRCNDAHRSHER